MRELVTDELEKLEEGANEACMAVIQRVRSAVDPVHIGEKIDEDLNRENAFGRRLNAGPDLVREKVCESIYRKLEETLEPGETDEFLALHLSKGDFERAYRLLMGMPLGNTNEEDMEYAGLVRKYHEKFSAATVFELLAQASWLEEIYKLGLELCGKKEFMRSENFFKQGHIPSAAVLSFICTYFFRFNDVGIRATLLAITENVAFENMEYSSAEEFEFILLFTYLAERKLADNPLIADLKKRLQRFLRVRTNFLKVFFKDIHFDSKAYRGIDRKAYETFWGFEESGSDLSEVIESPMGKAVLAFSESGEGKRGVFEDADEIIDGLNEFVQNSKLKDDAEILAILEECKFDFRYIRRCENDLRMGSKTGDCTAPGSVNFEKSLSWQVNPAYQVIKLQKGGRFLGRVNLTLGAMGPEKSIFVDAVEFNPQAQAEDAPYHKDAKDLFLQTLGHFLEMASAEGMKLLMYHFSNSSDYEDVLQGMGLKIKEIPPLKLVFTFIDSFADAKKVLARSGYTGDVKLWYQMMDASIAGTALLSQDKIAGRLEREVFNPGQIEHEEIADAMRSRDFDKAAEIFVEIYSASLDEIFGFTEVSVALVKRKLLQMYPLSEGISGHKVVLQGAQFVEVG